MPQKIPKIPLSKAAKRKIQQQLKSKPRLRQKLTSIRKKQETGKSWSPKIEREKGRLPLDKKIKILASKRRDPAKSVRSGDVNKLAKKNRRIRRRDPAKSVRSGDVGDFWDGT